MANNIDLSTAINNFQNAVYGKDVRNSLVDVAEAVQDAVNDQVITLDTTLTESGKGADAKATGDAVNDLNEYVGFRKWNLIDSFIDGVMIDNNGNANPDHSSWSSTDYVAVTPNGTYTQCSTDGTSVDISGGVYIAYYDSNKTFISRQGGNQLTVTIPNNCYYIRLSVQTENKNKLVFGMQTLRIEVPTLAIPHDNLENYTWLDDFAVLTSNGTIIKYNNNSFKTTGYIYLAQGTYTILPVSDGGMYITEYDSALKTITNHAVQSNVTYVLTVNSETWVTISCLKTQSTEILSEKMLVTHNAINVIDRITAIEQKKIIFYGDSITCLGNDFRATSWQGILKNNLNLSNAISVGIGGTHLCWRSNETYDLSNHVLGQNLPYGATRVTDGNGTPASLCSWERIEKTVPVDTDIVFVMGGTNDAYTTVSGSTEMSASNTTDTAWVASESYIGGDYDITTINGAILSIIMKLHTRCPNAIIVMCTPMSGRGDAVGENQLNYASWDQTINISSAIKNMSNIMSSPCFDLFGNSGVTPYNRALYMSDTVHPNDAGMAMIARYLIEKFQTLVPNF